MPWSFLIFPSTLLVASTQTILDPFLLDAPGRVSNGHVFTDSMYLALLKMLQLVSVKLAVRKHLGKALFSLA